MAIHLGIAVKFNIEFHDIGSIFPTSRRINKEVGVKPPLCFEGKGLNGQSI